MPKITPPIKSRNLQKLIRTKQKGTFCLGHYSGLVLKKTDFNNYYQLRYYFNKLQKVITLGDAKIITFPDAKKKALNYLRMLSNGIDPISYEKEQRTKKIEETKSLVVHNPFWKVSEEYLRFREENGAFKHSQKGKKDFSAMVITYAYPVIKNKDVANVNSDDLLSILQDPYVNKPAMASKLKSHLKGIFDFAILKQYRKDSNPMDMNGSLGLLLKSLNSKRKQASHYPALDYREIPIFIKQLFSRHTVGAYGLIFSILTASRSQAVRMMQWSQIDYQDRSWTIPLKNDKNKKDNANRTIYLSKASLQLLKWIEKRSEYVFVSKFCKTYSDSVFKAVILQLNEEHIRFGGPEFVDKSMLDPKTQKPMPITQHGTARSSFKCWASSDENAKKNYNVDAVEMCMLHERKDPLKGAYDRTKHIPERRRIMEDWGKFCTSMISETFWTKE